jgi:hypothetical protein
MSKKKTPPPKLDFKITKVQAKHDFTPAESVELGRTAGREQGEVPNLESALSSIKKDYQSRIKSAENRRDNAFRKLNDGFEMREVEAVIDYNDPKKGEKTIRFHLPEEKRFRGEIIRVEPMSESDLQTELRLIEQMKAPKGAPKPGEGLASVGEAMEQTENPIPE